MPTFDDYQMGWKLGTLWIPIRQFAGVISQAAAVDKSLNDGVQTHIAHTVVTDLAGFILDGADGFSHVMPIPWDWDNTADVQVRAHYLSTQSDAAESTVWTFRYELWAEDQVPTGPMVASGTPEDYTVSVTRINTAVANTYQTTPWASLLWTTYYTAGDIMMHFAAEYTSTDGTDDDDELFGVEFRYTIAALDPERMVTSR